MIKVKARYGFEHNGPRRRGEEFNVSDQTAMLLERRGLVRVLNREALPLGNAGGEPKSSASPADQASLEQTLNESGSGEQEEAEEPTPRWRRRKKKAKEEDSGE